MRISDFARRAFGIGGTVVLLSGCGGSQPIIEAPGAIPQIRADGRPSRGDHSWMRPEAKNMDLLYVDSGRRLERRGSLHISASHSRWRTHGLSVAVRHVHRSRRKRLDRQLQERRADRGVRARRNRTDR